MQQPPLGALHPTAWPRLEKRGKAGVTLRLPPKHHAALRQATLRLHIALSATLPVGLPRTTETRGTRRDNGTRARADTGQPRTRRHRPPRTPRAGHAPANEPRLANHDSGRRHGRGRGAGQASHPTPLPPRTCNYFPGPYSLLRKP